MDGSRRKCPRPAPGRGPIAMVAASFQIVPRCGAAPPELAPPRSGRASRRIPPRDRLMCIAARRAGGRPDEVKPGDGEYKNTRNSTKHHTPNIIETS